MKLITQAGAGASCKGAVGSGTVWESGVMGVLGWPARAGKNAVAHF